MEHIRCALKATSWVLFIAVFVAYAVSFIICKRYKIDSKEFKGKLYEDSILGRRKEPIIFG